MNGKRVLVFFPHSLFPARSGAHRRCIQILQGFHALGAEVTLASSTHTSDTTWRAVSETELRAVGVSRLAVHQASVWDQRYHNYARKFYQWTRRAPPLDSANYAPPTLCHWFARLVNETQPHVIVVTYAFFGRLVSRAMRSQSVTVMDSLDLVSLYKPRFDVMKQYFAAPPFSPTRVDPKILDENFFERLHFQVAPDEYRIYDAYQYTIAITRADADLIQQHTAHTRVLALPMTQETRTLENQYAGAALYTPGRNPFNVQGYLYFAARVLPRVLESEPTFCLHVTGDVCADLNAVAGIELCNYLDDLTPEYTRARFLICPILGKTGQQIKIVEAMAHGVPVIATRAAAEGSPLCHGENGLIAKDAAEFAGYVVQLWRDRELCRALGERARATIARDHSTPRLLQGLSLILDQQPSE